jgi:hypothetical protein
MTWTSLRDKLGNPPSNEDIIFIQQMKRELFFPCTCKAHELVMPTKNTPPKEMNKFMVFRRQLSRIAEQEKLSYDGKTISRVAAYMWNSASESEKEGYARLAKELKEIHQKTYPNYIEKRRRKSPDYNNFISCNGIYKKENCIVPIAPQVSTLNTSVNVVPGGQKSLAFEVSFPIQSNGVMYDMYNTYFTPQTFVNNNEFMETLRYEATINNYGINYTMGNTSAMTHQEPNYEIRQSFLDGDSNGGFDNLPINHELSPWKTIGELNEYQL